MDGGEGNIVPLVGIVRIRRKGDLIEIVLQGGVGIEADKVVDRGDIFV